MTRSQWYSITGGVALMASPFMPLFRNETWREALIGGSGPTVVWRSVIGVAIVLYGAAAVLMSVWFATARGLVLPSVLGITTGLLGALAAMLLGEPALAWALFLVGNMLLLAAALIDRRLTREHSMGDGSDG